MVQHIKEIVDPFFIPKGCGHDCKFKYQILLNQNSIGHSIISWCVENCKKKWGWYFVEKKQINPNTSQPFWFHQNLIMCFQNKKEATHFALSYSPVLDDKIDL